MMERTDRIEDRIRMTLRTVQPWMKCEQIVSALGSRKPRSIRSRVSKMVASGDLLRQGPCRNAWYALPGTIGESPAAARARRTAAVIPARKPTAGELQAEAIITLGGRPLSVAMAALAALGWRG